MNKNTPPSDLAYQEEPEMEPMPTNIKEQINSFLWCLLPPDMALGAAEKVAVEVYRMVSEAWEASQRGPNVERSS